MEEDAGKLIHDEITGNTYVDYNRSGVPLIEIVTEPDMSSETEVVSFLEKLRLIIQYLEASDCKLNEGSMRVDVNLDAYGDELFAGSISRIYPTINNATRTFAAEVTLPNNDERVRPGMFARVTLPYGKNNRVVIPDRSVNKLLGSGDRYVYILEADGTVRYSKVELGRRLGNEWEILSGVESGQAVVVKGVNALTNGCKVEVVNK
jgi:RND family efflux transporter MFP subunit